MPRHPLEDVAEREEREAAIGGPKRQDRPHGMNVGHDVAMGQHDPLGASRGAGGVNEAGQAPPCHGLAATVDDVRLREAPDPTRLPNRDERRTRYRCAARILLILIERHERHVRPQAGADGDHDVTVIRAGEEDHAGPGIGQDELDLRR
ncbi:MAG: hypothetical protein FD129_3443, partial [bacterium]